MYNHIILHYELYKYENNLQCLCIAPTYELAFQIGSVIEQMSKYVDIKVKYALRGEPC